MSCHNSLLSPLKPSRQDMDQAADQGRLLSLEIEFSPKCNLDCMYCYATDNHRKQEGLTKKEFCDVIIQAKDLGAETIIVLGGEPMIYPHIMDMLRFMRNQDLNIEIFTNGSSITKSIARKLYDLEVIVVLKMNSLKENIQDLLAGKRGAYQQIQTAFNNLKAAGYPDTKQKLGISTIICQQNYHEAVKMWQWLRDQNIIPYFEMITPQANGKRNKSLAVDNKRIKDLFYKISEIDSQKYGFDWEPQPPLIGNECLRHLYSCVVNSYGEVEPCVGVTIPVGNVREKKLKDIIKDSEIIFELRNYREHIKGPCRECEMSEKCYGCRGAAYQLTGDYLASDPLCWRNDDKLDEIIHLPVEADRLVPHKPPIRMVDKLVAVKEQFAISELNIYQDSIFIGEDGKLDEVAYLEIIAQAMAALKGFKGLEKGAEGFLLGAKRLKIYGRAGVGDRLLVSIYKVCEYGDLGIIKGEVFKGEEMIAEGEVKVWHKPAPL